MKKRRFLPGPFIEILPQGLTASRARDVGQGRERFENDVIILVMLLKIQTTGL